jgi:hypothetical protein
MNPWAVVLTIGVMWPVTSVAGCWCIARLAHLSRPTVGSRR